MNMAHLHLLLNHIPVLGSLGSLTLLILAARKKNKDFWQLAFQFVVLVGVLTLPVYFTGEPAEDLIEYLPGVSKDFIEHHEDNALYGLISTEILALMGGLGLFLLKKKSLNLMRYGQAMMIIALVNIGLMVMIAKYGGQIRHTEIRDGEGGQVKEESSRMSK